MQPTSSSDTQAASNAPEIPGYRMSRVLGKGGMATVYLAIQDIFERDVALKVMSRSLGNDPEFGQRFMREAQIVSKLIHPNIVTVYDVGMHDGAYYLSMEYIQGADLKESASRLDFAQKISIIKSIASALDISGAKGYVHRDIKPENIMVEDGSFRGVLMDFGIARASEVDISVTQAGTAIGTPHYMSPEQAKGIDVDPRADLYSLGVVLFYLLTGYVPFEGDSAVAIGIRHITEAVPELPNHLREMQWFLDKAMAKEPEARFQTGSEFIEALDNLDLDNVGSLHDGQGVEFAGDLDTPTVVSAVEHRYGDKTQSKQNTGQQAPESFTLKFDTQEPPTLNLKWPLYAAAGFVALLVVLGVYVVATYEPAPVEASEKKLIANDAQQNIADMVLGRQALTGVQKEQIALLREKIEQSHQDYQRYSRSRDLKSLVEQHRQVLAINPRDSISASELTRLVTELTDRIKPSFNAGQFKEAQRYLGLVLELFPEHNSDALRSARALLTQRRKIENLLAEGERFIKRNQYTSPKNANAVARFEQALAIAPQLNPATRGLEKVAEALVKEARQALAASNLAGARQAVNQALSIVPDYAPALGLERQLLSSSSRQERIDALLEQGLRLATRDHFFSPADNNAYASYKAVLAIDKRNNLARQRIKALPKALQTRTRELIKQREYIAAERMTESAMRQQPELEVLMQLHQRTQKAIEQHKLKHEARIGELRVSGAGRISLDKAQANAIVVDKKLFAKVSYFNFETDNTLLEAKLFRQGDALPIGVKQVFVKGGSGDREFVFDFPSSGAPKGNYQLDIVKSAKTLKTLNFQIGR